MVASPPPPLLSAVSQQQRYGLPPPAPASPLHPAPPSTTAPPSMATTNVQSAGVAERPTPSRASEIRRATKPIMEKRRRARINQCLTELKALILDALNKDPSRHSKLEKADILEMTVRHLQNVQRHQVAAALSTDPVVMSKFRAGFAECATEVSRFVTRLDGVEPSLRQRLVGHLTSCMSGLNGASAGGPTSPLGGVAPGLLISPLSVQIPGLGDLHGVAPSGPLAAAGGGGTAGRLQLGGLPLIPSRLPNGDLAFVLPTVAAAPVASGGNVATSSNSGSAAAPPPSWGPPTPTNTSTPTSPHPPRSPSPASSFGGSPLCSPGASDVGSEDASSCDAQMMLQRSPSCFSPPPSAGIEDLAALPRHGPSFFGDMLLHGLEATAMRCPEERDQRERPQNGEEEDDEHSGGGDDSVWRPW
ncbi:hypothetical protein V5799_019293 [Amblyomma americanum]|uniref:Transcription factor hes-1 n=1 Tax=Amblyomma americanum TaxID=6943 RepID=A0AAQ4EXB4_AMBAM